jgi:hypothetical protein
MHAHVVARSSSVFAVMKRLAEYQQRRCAASTTTAAGSAQSSSPPSADDKTTYWRDVAVPAFTSWLQASGIELEQQGVALQLDPAGARGLVATRPFRQGVSVLSVPMSSFALSASSLTETSPTILRDKAMIPTFEDVRREMTTFSVRDPVLHQQMHLAVLLAAERFEAAKRPTSSAFSPYFDVLPHPAINDTVVMGMHKDVLDPMQLMEWDDHQRVFLTVCRGLHERWLHKATSGGGGGGSSDKSNPTNMNGTASVPPVEVMYWAFRTVLSRMHLLPDRGLAPPTSAKHKLNYESFAAMRAIAEEESLIRRCIKNVKSIFSSGDGSLGSSDFRLVPTMVPLIDMCGHLSSSNVSVEVQPRPEMGSCVELQAVAAIAKGEPIGMCLNRSQSIAFTLYRFGFLPV